MSSIYWVDIISAIVDDVRNDASKPAALAELAPYYIHGHPLDVVQQLQERDTSDNLKYSKYPLIALMQDFTESYGESSFVKSEVTSMNIIICTNTDADWNAAQRYDNTFRTVLQPLYELLIQKLIDSKQFLEIGKGLVPHDKIDRLFWGRSGLYGNEGNIFTDRIDAIEIDNLELKLGTINKKC